MTPFTSTISSCDACNASTSGRCWRHQPGVYDVMRIQESMECDRGYHVWTPQVTLADGLVAIRCVRCRREERFGEGVPTTEPKITKLDLELK